MPACRVQYGQPPLGWLNAPRDLDEIRISALSSGRRSKKTRHLVIGSAASTPLLSVHRSHSINSTEGRSNPDRSASGSSEVPALPHKKFSAADDAKNEERLLSKNATKECEECSSDGDGETSHLLGYFRSRGESEQRTVEKVPAFTENINSKQSRTLPPAQDEMKQEEAESEREFERLPYDMQCYLRVLASETGKWPANGIRERTLCGSEMWVERESGEVAWKLINWDPPPREDMMQFMQEDLRIGDQILSLSHRGILPRATENGPVNTNLEARFSRLTEARRDTDSWSVMESLAPVHSRSAPVHLRLRAWQKRKRATGTGGVSRAIRNWFARAKRTSTGDEQTNGNTPFSIKEFLKRPWKKRGSHDSAICLESNSKRGHEWDSVGPRNEDFYSANTTLRFGFGSLSRGTCFGCHPF